MIENTSSDKQEDKMGSLGFVKDEIKFFMEKSYQFSFVYIAAVFAIIAGVKLEAMKPLSKLVNIEMDMLMVLSLCILNLAYLTLASACLFGILKRGYFILIQEKRTVDKAMVEWERFMRDQEGVSAVVWGVDNYFMVILYMIVWCASCGLLVYGIREGQGVAMWAAIIIGALHAFPLFNTGATVWINVRCDRLVRGGAEERGGAGEG